VVWQEGGYWFGVSATPGAAVSDEELLQIAESMKPYSSGPIAFPTTTTVP